MGNTYVNLTVLEVGIDQVRDAALASYIGAVGPDVVVYARADDEACAPVLGEQVTGILGATGITVGVMGDDVLFWAVHRAGQEVASGAVPDPAEVCGGDAGGGGRRMIDPSTGMPVIVDEPAPAGDPAAELVAALGRGDVDAVREALADDGEHVMATDRHSDLVTALGIPHEAVSWGYRYIAHSADDSTDLAALGLPPLEHIA